MLRTTTTVLRTTTTASMAALLGLALLAPTSAGAAGETCQGVPATHVGSVNVYELEGTEGRDVIVTNGAQDVRALGGDDLICVTSDRTRVDAGAGNDIVDATATAALGKNTAVLGPGADQYVGSAALDSVIAGTDETPSLDSEADVIDTGAAGANEDVVVSGQAEVVNPDRITMVSGTLAWSGIATPAGLLDGGASSRLELELDASGSTTLDSAGTLATTGAPTLSFNGFTEFSVATRQGSGPFEFRGTDARESLELTTWRSLAHRVDMGAGNDDLLISARHPLRGSTRYDGGDGIRDTITLTMGRQGDVDLDLGRGRLSTGRDHNERTTRARGFEAANVQAQDVELVGTTRANSLAVHACRARVEGLGGADYIRTYTDRTSRTLPCQPRGVTFLGGSGADRMWGGARRDRLIGGRGKDYAEGRAGRDVCQAERRNGCEVRG